MGVQSTFFNIDAIPARVFTSTKNIASKSHAAVFVQYVDGGAFTIVNQSDWELINNSVVFSENVTGFSLEVRVADSPDELDLSPSDIAIVSSIYAEVVIVSGIESDVSTVAGIATEVTKVAAVDSDIAIVAPNINSVNTVSTNINDVNTVSSNINDVVTVSTNIVDIVSVATNIDGVLAAESHSATAKEYATNPEDDTVYDWFNGVETSDYSAYHWSKKAEAWAATTNLPTLVFGDGGKGILVKSDLSGYETANVYHEGGIQFDSSANLRIQNAMPTIAFEDTDDVTYGRMYLSGAYLILEGGADGHILMRGYLGSDITDIQARIGGVTRTILHDGNVTIAYTKTTGTLTSGQSLALTAPTGYSFCDLSGRSDDDSGQEAGIEVTSISTDGKSVTITNSLAGGGSTYTVVWCAITFA